MVPVRRYAGQGAATKDQGHHGQVQAGLQCAGGRTHQVGQRDLENGAVKEPLVIAPFGLAPAARGTVTLKNRRGNIPTRIYNSPDGKPPAISRTPTYYFKA